MKTSRTAFVDALDFPLDRFQVDALDALDSGHSVLVAAPTGAGKTLVAEYAMQVALDSGARAFYTTPLKALSNQKYHDLVRAHGPANVGLLTGDNSVNGDAPIVVMTTEVLRNMIYARSSMLDNLRFVVLDEVHYLQNRYRGAVWEEVIIHLPDIVDLICLSATVSNAEEVAEWLRTVRGATEAIIEEHRPVELEHLYAVGDRSSERMHLLPTFVSGEGGLNPNPEIARLDNRAPRARPPHGAARSRSRLFTPWRADVAERLADEQMLPAIYFIFSRNACDDAVKQCVTQGRRLTNSAERRELRAIAERHTAGLDDDDLDALGYDAWITGLEAGYAAHHAGLVPPMKEAVEEGFTTGLLKVVFATETLSLGINMPARSVVIEKLTKFTGEHHEFLTPGEYTQLAGRAGRRGIDDRGYVVVLWNPFVPFDQVAGLASRRTYALTSSFRPTYNMTANLVRRYSAEQAHHLLNLSFAQYHADRDVVGLQRVIERTRLLLAERQASIAEVSDELADYRSLLDVRDQERRGVISARSSRLEALRPGDVVVGNRFGRAVVVKQDRGRPGAKVLLITPNRKVFKAGIEDLGRSVARVATIELPRPYAPRNPRFIREAAATLAALELDEHESAIGDGISHGGHETMSVAERLSAHPLADDPRLNVWLRAAKTIDRLERELARHIRRVESRADTLARQFDRVHGLLDSWRYVDEWALTDAGELLARLYCESDLLVAEALRTGTLDGLDPPSIAAVVSCCCYERRGPDSQSILPPRQWPSKAIAQRYRAVERIWRDLESAEQNAQLPQSRAPDPGFVPAIHAWAAGESLADVLEDEELTGGDFVRNVKQCIDLLRQIGELAPVPETAASARAAAAQCARGVIAASNLVPSE